MRSAYRAVAVSAIVAAASFVIRADATPPSQASEIQMQLGDIGVAMSVSWIALAVSAALAVWGGMLLRRNRSNT